MKRIIITLFILGLSLCCMAFAKDLDFDHSRYAKLLQTHLKNGDLDYASLQRNSVDLELYLRSIAKIDKKEFAAMSRDEKVVIYINAYNAYTIKSILLSYPVKSIKNIKNVWDKKIAIIAGEALSLNNIEHDILRPVYKDPRFHFALNCASKGCPVLRAEPYLPEHLEEQLEDAAFKFMNDRIRNPYDQKNNKFHASSIFKWFAKDFGDIRSFIAKYLKDDKSEFLMNQPKLKYQYDWNLNGLGN